jgi:hypothetical protein
MANPSIALRCYQLSGLFETELLLELMLRFWVHPFADDTDFRTQLLESAIELLKESVNGRELLEGIPPDHVNLVVAIWLAEWISLNQPGAEQADERKSWLDKVRKAIPSCFANQGDLA